MWFTAEGDVLSRRLLLGQYVRAAGEREGNRTLLYGNAGTSYCCCGGLLVVVNLTSTQGSGMLDRFTGIVVSTDIELLIEQEGQFVPTEAESADCPAILRERLSRRRPFRRTGNLRQNAVHSSWTPFSSGGKQQTQDHDVKENITFRPKIVSLLALS